MLTVRDSERPSSDPALLLNGEILRAGVHLFGLFDTLAYSANVRDHAVVEQLLNLTPSEIHPSIVHLSLTLPPFDDVETGLDEIVARFRFELDRTKDEGRAVLHAHYLVGNWKKMWSFNEYRSVLEALAAESGVSNIRRSGLLGRDAITLWLPITSATQSLREFERELWFVWERCHSQAEDRLASSVGTESVIALFEFPEEIRIPCEQYLLYFVEFLRNVGVTATAELQHRANGVLFAVRPSSGEEALDAIRRALEVYLELPAVSDLDPFGVASEIHVQQLISNIQHLRGQLALAGAVIQAKEATIQQQQLTINSQQLLSGQIVTASLRELAGPTDREEILGGTVALTKYEGKGFEVDIPEIFRIVRSWFSKSKHEDPDRG